ncbi:MAG TPA: hypothetical protein VFD05_02625 [Bacilli bacterium]|nr:hypothetical protein [Bacilli bacterium]
MKISKIVPKSYSEVKNLPRFNFTKKVKKQRRLLTPIAWLLSFPETWQRKAKIIKFNMESLKKTPYLLLANHNAFYDFKVATRAIFPRRATYVVALDGFIAREAIMREVGCIGTRKFITDVTVVKQIKRSLNELKHINILYPEARYSLVGTTAVLPESLGKLVKLLKVPIVTLISHGHHLSQPVWNLRKRKVKTSAEMRYLLSPEQIENFTVPEINKMINQAFMYDDYAWQKANNVLIKEAYRAEGLEAPLYKCPACLCEGKNITKGATLTCSNCGLSHELLENGELKNHHGKTYFTSISAWFDWQRETVKNEILNGTYRFEHDVKINMLPNSTGFYEIGKGTLTHDLDGFVVSGKGFGETFTFKRSILDNYSVHIEYNYFGRGHGISFSTGSDTFYMFSPEKTYLVTKVYFAVEELYKLKKDELTALLP